jgi:hypothetical protein
MPFEGGAVAFCQQGNRSPEGRSHAHANALHALDLSTPGTPAPNIVAAAPGEVVRVVVGAERNAVIPGGGFGNLVVIDHGEGFTTLYAHLAQVSVKQGQRVESGALLGTMGETGLAGNVHLHFSLHRAAWPAEGAPSTVPMHALVTADAAGDLHVRIHSSLEIECADSSLSPKGHSYVSENAAGTPVVIGPVGDDVRKKVVAARELVASALTKADAVSAALAKLTERGPEATRAELRKVLERDPESFQALYWVAVISLRDLDDRPAAREALAKLEPLAAKAPQWVAPWLLVRKAELAEKEGKKKEARELYRRAKAKGSPDDEELASFLEAAEKRLGK